MGLENRIIARRGQARSYNIRRPRRSAFTRDPGAAMGLQNRIIVRRGRARSYNSSRPVRARLPAIQAPRWVWKPASSSVAGKRAPTTSAARRSAFTRDPGAAMDLQYRIIVRQLPRTCYHQA